MAILAAYPPVTCAIEFQLIKRNSTGEEVWEDLKTGLIWSDRLDGYDHYEALEVCHQSGSLKARGYLQDLDFHLPSQHDYEEALADGFMGILPHMQDRWFWTSTLNPDDPEQAYVYMGNTQNFMPSSQHNADFHINGALRCVAHDARISNTK